jgi:hypothetical protein
VGTFLLAFVPLPEWVDEHWVRLAMLAAALVLPLVVGTAALFMIDPEDRPTTIGGRARAVLKGYPYTAGMALTLVLMTVLAPLLKVRDLLRRRKTRHVPIFVEPPDYAGVVDDLQAALGRGGITTDRRQASWTLRLPTRLLTFFAGGAVENLVADQLTTLCSDRVEVLLHPSDLVISGRELDAARANAIVTEQLTFTRAYMTWDKEAQELEDRLRTIWEEARAHARGFEPAAALERLHAVARDLRSTGLPYEEWEVLFREKTQVERELLQVMAGITHRPRDLTEAAPDSLGATRSDGAAGDRSVDVGEGDAETPLRYLRPRLQPKVVPAAAPLPSKSATGALSALAGVIGAATGAVLGLAEARRTMRGARHDENDGPYPRASHLKRLSSRLTGKKAA